MFTDKNYTVIISFLWSFFIWHRVKGLQSIHVCKFNVMRNGATILASPSLQLTFPVAAFTRTRMLNESALNFYLNLTSNSKEDKRRNCLSII